MSNIPNSAMKHAASHDAPGSNEPAPDAARATSADASGSNETSGAGSVVTETLGRAKAEGGKLVETATGNPKTSIAIGAAVLAGAVAAMTAGTIGRTLKRAVDKIGGTTAKPKTVASRAKVAASPAAKRSSPARNAAAGYKDKAGAAGKAGSFAKSTDENESANSTSKTSNRSPSRKKTPVSPD